MFRLLTLIAPPALKGLAATWSVRVIGRRNYDHYLQQRKPLIAVCWHQGIIPFMMHFRGRGALAMVSQSRDGELAARIAHRLGFRTARGSSSRGGREALSQMTDEFKKGCQAGLVVDGPRGPAREPKIGAIVLAQRTGAPILPMACQAQPGLRAHSWDQTLVPLPFSSVVIGIGDPLIVPSDATPDQCEALRLQMRTAINAIEARVCSAVGSPYPPPGDSPIMPR